MKQKLLLILLVFGSGNVIHGQIPKGTLRVGPSASFSQIKQQVPVPTLVSTSGIAEYTNTDLATSLGIGGFLADNFSVSVLFEYSLQSTKYFSTLNRTNGLFAGISPQYMVPISDRFYMPLEAFIGFNSQSAEVRGTVSGSDGVTALDGLGWGAAVGIEYLVGKRIGARLSFSYMKSS
ncbi:MAG: porin family protein, partial [Flavobacteriales bacterium]|nr:porin family protein [Flavobacteriales bacterium]